MTCTGVIVGYMATGRAFIATSPAIVASGGLLLSVTSTPPHTSRRLCWSHPRALTVRFRSRQTVSTPTVGVNCAGEPVGSLRRLRVVKWLSAETLSRDVVATATDSERQVEVRTEQRRSSGSHKMSHYVSWPAWAGALE